MIFVAFVEILMPSGSMRKYVSFVLGLMVMIVILNPLLNMAVRDFSMADRIVQVSEGISFKDLQLKVNSIKEGQREGIIRLYKKRLENQIKKHVIDMGYGEDVVAEVKINENYGTQDFGRVLGVKVVVKKAKEETGNPIKKVEIKVDTSKQPEAAEANSHQQEDGELVQEIVTSLVQTYGLPPADIQVVIQRQ